MKTKTEIVQDLLDRRVITAEDAVILLTETTVSEPASYTQRWYKHSEENDFNRFYDNCSCNPKNGGSGVCGCTLGIPRITC